MKKSQRLLQFGTLALFSSMIIGLVLYRGGMLNSKAIYTYFEYGQVLKDTLPPPWYDQEQFDKIIRIRKGHRSETERMFSSKMAPPIPPPHPDNRQSFYSLGFPDDAKYDSLLATTILQTRYEIAQFSPEEAKKFKQIHQSLLSSKEKQEKDRFFPIDPNLYLDSAFVLTKMKYGPQQLVALSSQEKSRFQVVLDSLTRPRMMSSKSGIIFISSIDSTLALKIVKSEKRPK